jgi:hypothetical protein
VTQTFLTAATNLLDIDVELQQMTWDLRSPHADK